QPDSGFEHEQSWPLKWKLENARDFLEVGNFRWKNDSEIHERLVEDLRRIRVLFQRSSFANDVVEIHAIFSEGNPVAVFKKLLLDSGLVDECTVSAVEVLETVAFLRPDEFGMMSGHVLVGQN